MKRILLTGGGTAGHVTPNIALFPKLKERGYDIQYIGSYNGIERELIKAYNIPYHPIKTGKLRRYFSVQNFTDPFRVIHGLSQAVHLMKSLKPDVIFSKGGFVSVPVVIAGRMKGIPVIIHESDMTPGLANKICFPFTTKVCCNFPETVAHLPSDKAVLTGLPIRDELLNGSKDKARNFCNFHTNKPVLLIMGGSLGAASVNTAIRQTLPELLAKYQVIHLCGKGKLDPSLSKLEGYIQFEYIKDELKDLLALSDVVISRAGANAICELLALHKPNILIPLGLNASRGDQILNARSFQSQGFSVMLEEDECFNKDTLFATIEQVYNNRSKYIDAMKSSNQENAVKTVLSIIEQLYTK